MGRPSSLFLAKLDASEIWLPVLGILLVAIAGVLSHWFGGRCPRCGERRVMRRTGRQKRGIFFRAVEEEWKCKDCGYVKWKLSGGGGGMGCGGGCGGG